MKREGEGKFRKYFEKIKETSFKNELVKVREIACTPLGRIMSNEPNILLRTNSEKYLEQTLYKFSKSTTFVYIRTFAKLYIIMDLTDFSQLSKHKDSLKILL